MEQLDEARRAKEFLDVCKAQVVEAFDGDLYHWIQVFKLDREMQVMLIRKQVESE